jgi:hypothetical protein
MIKGGLSFFFCLSDLVASADAFAAALFLMIAKIFRFIYANSIMIYMV